MYIKGDTLDDILHAAFRKILKSKNRTVSTKKEAREIIAASLELSDPRARFSLTEGRATLFSCLGETLWYLSGSDLLEHVEYYISKYRTFSDLPPDATKADGAYGPRLFGKTIHQINFLIEMMRKKKDTRQAVAQIFAFEDIYKKNKDVPCTCTIQFLPRGGRLHAVVNMRSNDAYRGLPHDVFAFTMIQELVARSLSLELGNYHHVAGSLHIYDRDEAGVKGYLDEGWQEKIAMPSMPPGDPWSGLRWLQDNEQAIRLGARELLPPAGIDPYWVDLARLLLIKALLSDKNGRRVVHEKNAMNSKVYDAYIRGRVPPPPEQKPTLFPSAPSRRAATRGGK